MGIGRGPESEILLGVGFFLLGEGNKEYETGTKMEQDNDYT